MFNKILKFSIISIFSLFLSSTAVYAENFTVQQLTNSSSIDTKTITDIDGDKFVWMSGEQGCGNRIYLYDGQNVRQVTSESCSTNTYDLSPRISGDYIVWTSIVQSGRGDNVSSEIYVYRISTGEIIQVTNDPSFYNQLPDVNAGGKVVWSSFPRDSTCCQTNIKIYDIQTGLTQTIVNDQVPYGASNNFPVISGNTLAWLWGNGNNEYEVMKEDLTTGQITRITNNKLFDIEIGVDGNNIVWRENDGSQWDIFMYDGAQIRRVTNNIYDDYNPRVSGDLVTWYFIENGFVKTGIYHISSGTTEIIPNADLPNVGGNRVSWFTVFNNPDGTFSRDVFVKNFLTGEISRITNGAYVAGSPFVSDKIVAWVEYSTNPYDSSVTNVFVAKVEPTISDLMRIVDGLNLEKGIENSLDVKLQRAKDELDTKKNNSPTVATNALQAFISEVEAQRGVKITNNQADELVSFANNLIKIVNGIKNF